MKYLCVFIVRNVLYFSKVLRGGPYRLSIEFTGVLDDSLRGFYRTKHIVKGEVNIL